MPNEEGVEHVAKTNIDVIMVSYGANDIGSKEFFPVLVVLMKRWSRSSSLDTRGVS